MRIPMFFVFLVFLIANNQHAAANPSLSEADQCFLAVVCVAVDGGSFSCPEETPSPNLGLITVTNSCGTALIRSRDLYSGGSCPSNPLTITRRYTITDDLDTVICNQLFTIIDQIGPNIENLPSDALTDCNNIPPIPSNLIAFDNCGASSVDIHVQTSEETIAGDCLGSYTLIRTFSATDFCGNTSTATQTIEVIDNTPPVLGTIPTNITVQCDAIPVAGEVTATDECGGNLIASLAETTSNNCANSYTITRVWTATDDCGNNSTAMQIITVNDAIPPVFDAIPTNTSAECDAIPAAATVTATDNCSTATVSLEETIVPIAGDPCPNNYALVRTWTATDACGNNTVATQTITVSDNTAPVFLAVPSNTSADCDAIPTAEEVTATDNCSGNIVASLEEAIVPISSGDPCPNNYAIVRTWTATDACGNSDVATQIITVFDQTAPTLSDYPADLTVACNEEVPAADVLTATDNCGSASVSFTEDNSQGCAETGVIIRTWTATDECMNETVHSQTITLSNSQVVNCPDDINVACNSGNGSTVEWETPRAISACDDTAPTCGPESIPGFIYLGEFNDSRYYCSGNSNYTWTNANATAIANGGHLVVINDAAENTFIATSILAPRVWIGLNDANTEGSFEWSNGESVNYTNWASGQPDNYNNQDYTMLRANGYDIWYDFEDSFLAEFVMEIPCTGGSIGTEMTQVEGPSNGSVFPEGTTTIGYEYINSCGVTSTCSFTVTVDECCEIDFTCPADLTVDCNTNGGAYVTWDTPTANSLCVDVCPADTYIAGHIYLGEFNGHRYYCSSASNFNWPQANAAAIANGGNLLVVNDAGENAFVTNNIMASGVWLGINDAENEGTFEWQNGDPVSYQNWADGEPDDYGDDQDYGFLNGSNGQWYDRNVGDCYEYIMEIPCGLNVEQVSGPANGSFFPAGETQNIVYTVTDNAGFTESCSFTVSVEDCSVDYCDAYASSCFYFWLKKVELGDINKYSGASTYSDFTNVATDLMAGSSYPMTMKQDFYDYTYDNYFYVFIDFNQDGDFDDAGEYVYSDFTLAVIDANIHIPSSALNGSTRMRVIMSYYCISDPCGYISYGEVEDYTVNIINNGNARTAAVGNNDIQIPLVSQAEAVKLENSRPLLTVQGEMNVYPNPATDFITVDFISTVDEEATMVIRNVLGQVVHQQAVKVIAGDNTVSLNLPSMASGNYLLYLEGSSEQKMKAVVIR